MNWKLPQPTGGANDNAGERCPHCNRWHHGASLAELDEIAEHVRDVERDEFHERYAFGTWPLDRLPARARGIPGVCPIAFSDLERARLAMARCDAELLARLNEHPDLEGVVSEATLRSADCLRISGLEPLGSEVFAPADVLIVYSAAGVVATELERGRASDIKVERASVVIARALAPLRRTARARALPADDRDLESEQWRADVALESQSFESHIARTLPTFRRLWLDSGADGPSARAVASAITEQRDDGAGACRYAAFPAFKTMRREIEKQRRAQLPKAKLLVHELAKAITMQVHRDHERARRDVESAAVDPDSAMNW